MSPLVAVRMPRKTCRMPGAGNHTPSSQHLVYSLGPVGALAGFDSAGSAAEPVGALAGFDSAETIWTASPSAREGAAAAAARRCRATAERSIPNSRAIRRRDQPWACKCRSVSMNAILS